MSERAFEEEQSSQSMTKLQRALSQPGFVGPSSAFARVGGACIYKNSNSVYGSRYPTELREPKFGLSNRFSDGIAASGFRNSGFCHTSAYTSKILPASRYIGGATDWTAKIG
eukprot:TRINITY_DN88616_c0_g1_i1.p1 TRINITY_DN88616_c0_g1~~TRINITY_DN88616_c0_g1_i1.p1  ORF type:complete len:112 (-),score=12.73 TRINITY_DN88616_c0_g1_i1:44-379(-)